MHDRRIRLCWFGLILAIPPLIEAMSPAAGETWAASAGRVALVEVLVIGGAVFASRQRRAMREGWYVEPTVKAIAASPLALDSTSISVPALAEADALRRPAKPVRMATPWARRAAVS